MIAAIIQARMSSTRFPKKVFTQICGKPLLWHIVNRLRFSKKIDNILIATSLNPKDEKIEDWALANGIACYRGDENNVLDRYYHAAKSINASIIARITSDDPFKDPVIIDNVINLLQENDLDFACNNNPPTFPEGLDTEIFTFSALEKAYKESMDSFEQEHVTQYFYRHKDIFRQQNYPHTENLSFLRWTIDTETDLAMAQVVYEKLFVEGKIFLMEDILKLISKNPSIASINKDIERSTFYKN